VKTSVRIPRIALDAVTLHAVGHYHQTPGMHPAPILIPPLYERVELVTAGRGWVRHHGGWREVVPGDLIWNRPGDETIGRSDFKSPYHCLFVHLVSRKRAGLGMPRFSRWRDLAAVRAFTEESAQLFLREDLDRHSLRDYVVGQLVLRVRLHAEEFEREERPQPLQAAVEFLERHFAETCRIDEIAAEAGWSVTHLHEMFQRHLQTSPHRMLVQLRLRAARERLASTDQPMKQIGFECGFTDAAAFAKVFKTNVGMTPGGYRARYRRLAFN
jgi:AraC-like DNA-binding protein